MSRIKNLQQRLLLPLPGVPGGLLALETLLLLMLGLVFFTQAAALSSPPLYLAALITFPIAVGIIRYTPEFAFNPRRSTGLESLLMVVLIACCSLIYNSADNFIFLYLLPVVASALGASHRATEAVLVVVLLAFLVVEGLAGQNLYDSSYWLRILLMMSPMLVLAFVMTRASAGMRQKQRVDEAWQQRDALTGFFNMRAFARLSEEAHQKAVEKKTAYSILMIDLDELNNINQKFGNDQGDRTLKTVAETIERSTRQDDILVRYGGDEFLVLLPGADAELAITIKNRIRQNAYNITLAFDASMLRLKLSIGAASFPENGKHTKDVLQAAHAAIRTDKELRRHRPTQ
ncbi:MAG: GGDEF domain-containing protein [Gammaproteobacteria bacterium]